MNKTSAPKGGDKSTRREFMKTSVTAVMGANCGRLLATDSIGFARSPLSASVSQKSYPCRVISWWSTVDDLAWPARSVRDKIRRRADQMAAAEVNTAIQFGFHFRFDFAWCFGAVHGYLADVAAALHERNIRFLDHFSCNAIARPRTPAGHPGIPYARTALRQLVPDAIAAREAGYAGYRFNDLREISIVSGEPTYSQGYLAEFLCHNNPDSLAMHREYLKRLFAEVPLDGLMQDDMIFCGSFPTCGCRYCREKFRRQYGHELPPLSDRDFWGDTSGSPDTWGNYSNPAFRDWVHLRYQSPADHLKMVRETIGPDKILMTCCSNSGSARLNAYGLSAEGMIEELDWVMMENCGLSTDSARWPGIEPEAMLHKAIAASKSEAGAPAIACSYFIYPDGAYLGWAIAHFWGVANWASTLWGRLPADPPDAREEAELIRPFNRWETADALDAPGLDVGDLQLAFIRASRDNGWRDSQGLDSWQHACRWVDYLSKNSIGYRFVVTRELEANTHALSTSLPLVLDGCAHLSDRVGQTIRDFVGRGGCVWVVPPLGTHDERGRTRKKPLLETLTDEKAQPERVLLIDSDKGPSALPELMRERQFAPRIRRISGPTDWSARLRLHGQRLCLHLLNRNLQAEAHPSVKGGRGEDILYRIASEPVREPLVLELDCSGLPSLDQAVLASPELSAPRSVMVKSAGERRLHLTLNLEGIRLYAMVVKS